MDFHGKIALRQGQSQFSQHFFKYKLSFQDLVEINTDKAPAYVSAIKTLTFDKELNGEVLHRPIQYLNNVPEQDHKFIKWRIKPMLGFFSFKTANWILQGIEAMYMIKKIQIKDFFRCFGNEKIFMNILMGITT